MKVQIAIIGAGPAGLFLSRMLDLHGISNIVVEKSSRDHVEQRLRAGVLEPGTAELLTEIGAGKRMQKKGLVHDGFEIIMNGKRHRIDLQTLVGKPVTVYGQTEITKDLNQLKLQNPDSIVFEAQDVTVNDFENGHPFVTYIKEGESYKVACDFIAGCDGYHGICREMLTSHKAINGSGHEYPYAWLGILAEAPPLSNEIVYANSQDGFALYSMRSIERSRNYIQCNPNTNIADWSDDRIWNELQHRIGDADIAPLTHGKVLEKGITPMRSYLVNNMRYKQIFLAGDAAHIMPPTGAKGLNLAVSDARDLAHGIIEYYQYNNSALLNQYSSKAVGRAKNVRDFAMQMTEMLHKKPGDNGIHFKAQLAMMENLVNSTKQSTEFARNYTGLNY